MIVVIDSNVWVSALLFGSPRSMPWLALDKAQTEDSIASCAEIEAEIVDVFTRQVSMDIRDAMGVLQAVLAKAMRVELTGTVHICRDPDDDIVLECAQAANANLIITGDNDLLALGSFAGARIVTPAQYVRREY